MALATERLGTKVLTVRGLTKTFGDQRVVDGVDFHLDPGERIGILGPNGAGKSTFVSMLAGVTPPDAGEIEWGETVRLGYYDQESVDLDDRQRLIEFIEEEAPLIHTPEGERVDAAKMLEWFLFPRPMQWGRIGSLSGGERRRLYLLRTLVLRPNVLILDEPTNDLDIQTLNVLEEFLDNFSGSLIVVSHDRYFLDRTVDYILPFENGILGKRYPSPYETYRRLREEDEAADRAQRRAETAETTSEQSHASTTANGAGSDRSSGGRTGLSWKEQRELERLEAQIASWEEGKAALLTAINRSGSNYERMQQLAAELDALDERLDDAMQRWTELAERA